MSVFIVFIVLTSLFLSSCHFSHQQNFSSPERTFRYCYRALIQGRWSVLEKMCPAFASSLPKEECLRQLRQALTRLTDCQILDLVCESDKQCALVVRVTVPNIKDWFDKEIPLILLEVLKNRSDNYTLSSCRLLSERLSSLSKDEISYLPPKDIVYFFKKVDDQWLLISFKEKK